MADSSAYSHRKRAKSIGRSDGTARDEVERLQAKLDAVLTTLNDSSLAPEDAISRALAAASQGLASNGTEPVETEPYIFDSPEVNRAFAILTLRNLAADDSKKGDISAERFKSGAPCLATLASTFGEYKKLFVDGGIHVVRDAIKEGSYLKQMEKLSDEEQHQYYLAMLVIVHVVAFKAAVSPACLADRFDSALKHTPWYHSSTAKDAIISVIATLRRGWLRRLHELLWKFEAPVHILVHHAEHPDEYFSEELQAVWDQVRLTAVKGGLLYAEAIKELMKSGRKLAFHPLVAEQYAAFETARKQLEKKCGKNWTIAMTARLPEAELIEPSKFPDLVYAACLYYKTQDLLLVNWKPPSVTPTLSKTEVLRLAEDTGLTDAEIETVIEHRIPFFFRPGMSGAFKSFTDEIAARERNYLKPLALQSRQLRTDNELTRLSDDVKVMICLLLAPRDLVSLSGVNKTLRQFVHVNASRMVSNDSNTLVLSLSAFDRLPEWEFFVISPCKTMFGSRRYAYAPVTTAQGTVGPSLKLGSLRSVSSVIPWLRFPSRCDVAINGPVDSGYSPDEEMPIHEPMAPWKSRRLASNGLMMLANLVSDLKSKLLAEWKGSGRKQLVPISVFLEKGLHGSEVELRALFTLFANSCVSNVVIDQPPTSKRYGEWEDLIIAASASVHRLRSFQFETGAYPVPRIQKASKFLDALCRHNRRCQFVTVKGVSFPLKDLLRFFENMCRLGRFRIPLSCTFELWDEEGAKFNANWRAEFAAVAEKFQVSEAAQADYNHRLSTHIKLTFGQMSAEFPEWYRRPREYHYLNWIDDDIDDYGGYGGHDYDSTFDYGSDWASA